MAGLFNVVLRGTVYHFRRGVPDDLRRRLKRRELVRSLGTGDIRAAKLAACRLYVASEGLFSALRGAPMLTEDQIAHLVQDFYAYILDRENAGRLARGSLPAGVREMRITQYATMADKARDALASNRLEEAHFATLMMLKRQGIALDELTPVQAAQAKQALLRAGVDLSEALKARYEGNFNYEPHDKLLKTCLDAPHPNPWPPSRQEAGADATSANKEAAAPAESTPPEPCFSQTAGAFRTSQLETKRWDQQTAAQARATFRLFVEVCGDKPVAAYTRKDASRFRDLIERLPQDYSKHPRYRSLTVEQILAAHTALAPETRSKPITQKTVKRHCSALSSLWNAAVSREDAATNIFSDFRFANSRKASEQRDMWERPDLQRLFTTPVWTGCAAAARRTTPGSVILRDEKFWLPLIAVFTGLRQEEICQLHVEDIRQDEDIWYLDINDRPPRKLNVRRQHS